MHGAQAWEGLANPDDADPLDHGRAVRVRLAD